MEQRIWRRRYSAFVGLPCPHCGVGKLKAKAESFHREETAYSLRYRSEIGSYHELDERFSCLLVCDRAICKEVVAVGGFVDIDEDYGHDEEGEPTIHETTYFCPKSMFPAPRVIGVSKKLSPECQKDLISSFALLWADYGACANRLRSFVEHFLNQLNVSRVSENGKGLNLYQRIALFGKTYPSHALSFDALREVGNRGSHAGDADFDDLIKCYHLLQRPITELIDKPHEEDALIAQRLIDKNKRKKSP
ncbi:DUF4145 domain-containing protein [Rhizobium ruizarguesonis]|uniref:DUF4145 domain-containing protein n=1 Tax=Rhizobium ruizarguesonis TaxID=2081791 RepID=UPI00372492B4